jgi:hypothetical protein
MSSRGFSLFSKDVSERLLQGGQVGCFNSPDADGQGIARVFNYFSAHKRHSRLRLTMNLLCLVSSSFSFFPLTSSGAHAQFLSESLAGSRDAPSLAGVTVRRNSGLFFCAWPVVMVATRCSAR